MEWTYLFSESLMTGIILIDIFFYVLWTLVGGLLLFAIIRFILEVVQRTIQIKFKFKFPIIGDALERGYKISTDKSTIKEEVQEIMDSAGRQRFAQGEALKVIADFGKLLLKNNDAKFHDEKQLPHSKEKILGALIVEVSKGNIDREVLKQGLLKLSFYQRNIGRKPRSLRLLSTGEKFSSDPTLKKFENLQNPTVEELKVFAETVKKIIEPNEEDDFLTERNIVEMGSFLNWAEQVEQKSEKPSK